MTTFQSILQIRDTHSVVVLGGTGCRALLSCKACSTPSAAQCHKNVMHQSELMIFNMDKLAAAYCQWLFERLFKALLSASTYIRRGGGRARASCISEVVCVWGPKSYNEVVELFAKANGLANGGNFIRNRTVLVVPVLKFKQKNPVVSQKHKTPASLSPSLPPTHSLLAEGRPPHSSTQHCGSIH